MKLQYELYEDDIVAFNMYHLNHSALVKKRILTSRIMVPVIYILVGIMLTLMLESIYYVIFFTASSLLWVIFYRRYYMFFARRNVQKTLKEGKTRGMTGRQELIIEKNRVIEITDTFKGEYTGKFLQEICSDDNYFYLYLDAVKALVVPKNALDSNSIDEKLFIESLKFFVEK
jgi:hypothetical protein